MKLKIKELKNKEIWENFLLGCEEKSFLQSWNWGEFQKATGERVWRFGLYEDQNLVAISQVIKVQAKRGTFLFVPHGPVLRTGNSKSQAPNPKQIQNPKSQILNSLLEKLKKIAKKEKAGFIRIAPIWERSEENKKIFKDLGFREAPIHIHPEITWQLEVTLPTDELLMTMRITTSYLIKQGFRNKDLKIFRSQDIKDLKIFNEIYQETAKHHQFTAFSFDYLKKQFLAFLSDNEIVLFLAKYKGEIIAGAIIVFWQDIAFYHHGASSQKYPKIPASYLLQWEAICEARKRGCRTYNFWGIAERNWKLEIGNWKFNKHPWAGLTLFKQGFGGYRKEYARTQDFILSQKYWLNFVVERLRKIKRGY